MSKYDSIINHFKEILNRTEFASAEDRKALWRYANEMYEISRHSDYVETHHVEAHKMLQIMTKRFVPSTPAWVRTGIQNVMKELMQ